MDNVTLKMLKKTVRYHYPNSSDSILTFLLSWTPSWLTTVLNCILYWRKFRATPDFIFANTKFKAELWNHTLLKSRKTKRCFNTFILSKLRWILLLFCKWEFFTFFAWELKWLIAKKRGASSSPLLLTLFRSEILVCSTAFIFIKSYGIPRFRAIRCGRKQLATGRVM